MSASRAADSTKVLVVEDDAIIAMMVEDMLSDLGCVIVATAGKLEPALALAETLSFDLAMLDVNLNGKESFPIAEVLTRRGVPFVFATGYGARVTASRYRDAPTLQKPYDQKQLAGAIATALAARPDGGAAA